MLMGTFTVTMSVEACRIHFFHTIKTIFDGKISIYSYELENGNISDAILNPRYLPDGYQLVEEHRTDTSSVMKYSRADENLIFNQKIISNEKMIFDMSFDCTEQIAVTVQNPFGFNDQLLCKTENRKIFFRSDLLLLCG